MHFHVQIYLLRLRIIQVLIVSYNHSPKYQYNVNGQLLTFQIRQTDLHFRMTFCKTSLDERAGNMQKTLASWIRTTSL